jgi:hypothetical protein
MPGSLTVVGAAGVAVPIADSGRARLCRRSVTPRLDITDGLATSGRGFAADAPMPRRSVPLNVVARCLLSQTRLNGSSARVDSGIGPTHLCANSTGVKQGTLLGNVPKLSNGSGITGRRPC